MSKNKTKVPRRKALDFHQLRSGAFTCASCARIEHRLNTAIAWIAQAAGSPLSISDAERLINEIGNE